MKYKILLAGKNKSVIDDFFNVMGDEFDCMTTSVRSDDMANHMKYFKPDVFVYCFASETKDDILRLCASLESLDKEQRGLILIGNVELCNEFMSLKPEYAKLILYRPIVGSRIKKEILDYLSEQKRNNFKITVRKIKEDTVPEEPKQEERQEEKHYSSGKDITAGELEVFFEEICAAMEELDMDIAMEVFNKMAEYNYMEEEMVMFEMLGEAVAEYDADKCEEIIEKWEDYYKTKNN